MASIIIENQFSDFFVQLFWIDGATGTLEDTAGLTIIQTTVNWDNYKPAGHLPAVAIKIPKLNCSNFKGYK